MIFRPGESEHCEVSPVTFSKYLRSNLRDDETARSQQLTQPSCDAPMHEAGTSSIQRPIAGFHSRMAGTMWVGLSITTNESKTKWPSVTGEENCYQTFRIGVTRYVRGKTSDADQLSRQ
jgi:hypothetical protein